MFKLWPIIVIAVTAMVANELTHNGVTTLILVGLVALHYDCKERFDSLTDDLAELKYEMKKTPYEKYIDEVAKEDPELARDMRVESYRAEREVKKNKK